MDTANGELGSRDRDRFSEPLRDNEFEAGETDKEFDKRLRQIEQGADAAEAGVRQTIDEIRRVEQEGARLTEEEAARLAKSQSDIEEKKRGFFAKIRNFFRRDKTDEVAVAGLGLKEEGSGEKTDAGEETAAERQFFAEGEKEPTEEEAVSFSDLEEQAPTESPHEEAPANEHAKIALTGPADFKRQARQIWHEIIETPVEQRQEMLREKQMSGIRLSRAEKNELKLRVGTTPMSKAEKKAYQMLVKAGSKENLDPKYREIIEADEAKEAYTSAEYEQMKAGEIPWKASALWQAIQENNAGHLAFPISAEGTGTSGYRGYASSAQRRQTNGAETAGIAAAALAGGAVAAATMKGEKTGGEPLSDQGDASGDDADKQETTTERLSEELKEQIIHRFITRTIEALSDIKNVDGERLKEQLAALQNANDAAEARKTMVEAGFIKKNEAKRLSDEQVLELKLAAEEEIQHVIDVKENPIDIGADFSDLPEAERARAFDKFIEEKADKMEADLTEEKILKQIDAGKRRLGQRYYKGAVADEIQNLVFWFDSMPLEATFAEAAKIWELSERQKAALSDLEKESIVLIVSDILSQASETFRKAEKSDQPKKAAAKALDSEPPPEPDFSDAASEAFSKIPKRKGARDKRFEAADKLMTEENPDTERAINAAETAIGKNEAEAIKKAKELIEKEILAWNRPMTRAELASRFAYAIPAGLKETDITRQEYLAAKDRQVAVLREALKQLDAAIGEPALSGKKEERRKEYEEAVKVISGTSEKITVSLLQRRLKVGYNRAAEIMGELESDKIVGPDRGPGKGRERLVKSSHN